MDEAKDIKTCEMCEGNKSYCGGKMCGDKSCCGKCHKGHGGSGMGGGVYGLAFIGALVYFMQTVTTFTGGIMALLKAVVWPALLVYNLLSFLMV